MPAAKAAQCAGQQKPALFWALSDWLFANQNEWAQSSGAASTFRQKALEFGADAAKFDACLQAPETEAAVKKDMEKGQSEGVEGTPAFYVNDWFISGAVPFEDFKTAIENALAGKHPPPTPTPLPAGVAPYDADPSRPGLTYDGSPMQGDAKAPLVLIAFEDFKCQYCATFAKDVEPTLRDKYVKPGQLRIVWKHFPIEAPNAAVASMCAAAQGKFWEYHDLLFSKQAEWQDSDKAALANYAKSLGLDEAKFKQCQEEAPSQPTIEADFSLGQQVGVQSTPYFLLLNVEKQTGARIPGALPLDQFEKQLEQIKNPPPTPAASGAAATATPGQ